MGDMSKRSDGRRGVMSCIVRIYRRGNGNARKVAGTVEFPETAEHAVFHDFEELRAILSGTDVPASSRPKR